MKIAIITPFSFFPATDGGRVRIYNIIKALSKSNKIVCLTPKNQKVIKNKNINIYQINSIARIAQFFNPFFIFRSVKILKKEKPKFIQIEFIWHGFHAIILKYITGIPFVVDEHNVEYLRFKRTGSKLTPFLKIYEKIVCSAAKKILCVSELDKQQLIKLGIEHNKILIVPNGVNCKEFSTHKISKKIIRQESNLKNKPAILFFGQLDYKPNIEAVDIIYYKIMPKVLEKKPDTRFIIVGKGSLNGKIQTYKHKNLVFVGFVDQIQDYINASDFVICPLISGGGTRIKILESISCGKQVISTRIGAEGLINEATKENLILADDWNHFSKEIINLIKRPKKPYVQKSFLVRYDWNNIVSKYISNLGE